MPAMIELAAGIKRSFVLRRISLVLSIIAGSHVNAPIGSACPAPAPGQMPKARSEELEVLREFLIYGKPAQSF